MRLSRSAALFAAAFLCAAAFVFGASDKAADFSALLERYYEDYLALFPVDAAGSGDSDRRYDHVWQNEISAESRTAEARLAANYLTALAQFDRAALSASEQLSYDVQKWSLEVRQAGLAVPTHLLPVNQFWGPPLLFAQMGSGASLHRFETEKDFRNFIARADGFSAWVDTAIANMREGIARGLVQPRILMERVLPQYEPLMVD
ncbi:MAG TPA: DUF885 family protein, partial [Opitutus sp.]|nr:DUF885 family protein [Opitutus sp.]